MLTLICFLVCVFAAVGAARDSNTGFIGYALAVTIGLAMGVGSTWAFWTLGERLIGAVQRRPEARRELYLRLLYAAAVLWILSVAFIAVRVIPATLRLVL